MPAPAIADSCTTCDLSHVTDLAFTLRSVGVYGWTMYPGYGEMAYRSPIIVFEVRPRGYRRLDVDFLNIFYAAGLQHMTYRLRTLRRERSFLIAEQIREDGKLSDRVVAIEPLTRAWFLQAAPQCSHLVERLFDDVGEPSLADFKRLAS